MSSMNKYDPSITYAGAKLALAYDALKASLHKLPGKDLKFAKSMLAAFEKPGHGSHKQQYWLVKMAETASGVPENDPNFGIVELLPTTVTEKETPKVGIPGFESVYALFAKAKQKLKYPKINLKLPDQSTLLLYLSGQNSTKPGVINITNGKPYGQNKWYGRIHPDGTWEQPKNYVPTMTVLTDKVKLVGSQVTDQKVVEIDQIEFVLKALANDPYKVAAAYGNLTGNCCFCKKPLSDPHSTAVGFGYICAVHYGLGDMWKSATGVLSPEVAQGPKSLGELLKKKIEFSKSDVLQILGEESKNKSLAAALVTETTQTVDDALEPVRPEPKPKRKKDYLF